MRAEQAKLEVIERVCDRVEQRIEGSRADLARTFVREFFRDVPPDDLAEQSADNLYGMALNYLNFARSRKPGVPKIRVYNPSFEDASWHSHHTVVEIVNDDMPFLIDSVTAALNAHDLTLYLIIHPIMTARRDAAGELVELRQTEASEPDGFAHESMVQIQINEQSGPEAMEAVRAMLEKVLADVRAAVTDWRAMRGKVEGVLADLDKNTPPLPRDEVDEARELLRWIHDDHFTFVGYQEYLFSGDEDALTLTPVEGAALGVMKDQTLAVFDGLDDFANMPPDVQAFLRQPKLVLINKTNQVCNVHRRVHMDAVFVKIFGPDGSIVGERLFVGLFTSTAYSSSPRVIPVLRRKVKDVVEQSGFLSQSHAIKALLHILETYPRDELFQIDSAELSRIALGILHLQERQRIALFARYDPFERFVTCMVYVPKDHLTTELRLRFQRILEMGFNGPCTAFYTQMSDDALGRILYVIKTVPGFVSDVETADLEAKLIEAGRAWTDVLREALVASKGEGEGLALLRRYGTAFPTAYRETYSAQEAVRDIGQINEVAATGRLGIYLYQPLEVEKTEARLKLVMRGASLPLSDVLPRLENMGFKVVGEVPYEIRLEGETEIWIHDFTMVAQDNGVIDLSSVRAKFEEALAKIWTGEMEDDEFNKLVLQAKLDWRAVIVLRAYAKFLRQAAFPFSQSYIAEALGRYSGITRQLVALFEARFDPANGGGDALQVEPTDMILEALDEVESLDDDRILRRYLNLIQCTLRTSFYQPDETGTWKSYVSFKLDSQRIEELPKPRPMVEIFVYSPRVEATHLRGGRVARGGLRWSDRREDFRTEILGLMKAQMVKNAVIVPVGSKGGFVVKRPPAEGGREAFQAEGVACYKIMIGAMLDITDNLVGGDLVPPLHVVRHDGDDPYLVVAADKGTATFSDIANGVSEDYGFWLGDAFASGGSAGYDHKKMGITARGAWESVKRHFREIGVNCQEETFTCVGVGDMSGDVFGNGMLLSRQTKLLAAFNHLHVFVDPDPDPAKSWEERKRMFDLPRSTWDDYDKSLISKGGGVFDRKSKSISLTPEIKALTGIEEDRVAPNDLIKALLTARVDLLWFGGIGTYIKAVEETDVDVGDRANDAVRVDGKELRCRIVGEGANLGVTQLGRIEFARNGGRLNTDAVDNSAGVDCSDHEVNIKVVLGDVVGSGDMTLKQRNELLEAMTDEVGQLVLADNYRQTLAITMMEEFGVGMWDRAARFIRKLERAGRLDRAIEFLPDEESIAERRSRREKVTRPELSVLLAYAKIVLYDQLLESDLPDDPRLVNDLVRYFPKPLQERFKSSIETHRLRREIIATYTTNSMVNRVGSTFVSEMNERTGMEAPEIARAYAVVRDAFSLRDIWKAVDALDNKVPARVQHAMLREVQRLVTRMTLWFLRNGEHPIDITRALEIYKPGLEVLSGKLFDLISPEAARVVRDRAAEYGSEGVPVELATRVAILTQLSPGCDVVRIAGRLEMPVEQVGTIYYWLGANYGFDWLRREARALPSESTWHDQAVSAIVDDSVVNQIELAERVLRAANGSAATSNTPTNGPAIPDAVSAWAASRSHVVRHVEDMLHDMQTVGAADIAMLAVANRELRVLLSD